MNFSAVSMVGKYILDKEWYGKLSESWLRIKNIEKVSILDDGSLSEREYDKIKSIGHDIIPKKRAEEAVNPILSRYPNLRKMRSKSVMFKKLIDTTVLCGDSERVLYLDSDVYVKKPISLPIDCPQMLFSVSDVTGYSGSPVLPFRVPIVRGLNGGVLLYDPKICDWGFLDSLAEKYLLGAGKPWWLEQTCWAALAGHTDSKGAFDGRDVRNVSGLKKRTPQEVKENTSKWIGSSESYEDERVIDEMVSGASIVHFAGPGKCWIGEFAKPESNEGGAHVLRWEEVGNASFYERAILALRMIWNNRE